MNKIVFDFLINVYKYSPVFLGLTSFFMKYLFESERWPIFLILGFIMLALRTNHND